MLKNKFFLIAVVAVTIMGCDQASSPQTSTPATQPTAAQSAELEAARTDAIAAECALYAQSSVTPEGC